MPAGGKQAEEKKEKKVEARKPTKTNSHLHQTDVDVNASSQVHKFTSSHFGVFGGGIIQKDSRRANATNCPICRFYVLFSLCVNNFLRREPKKGPPNSFSILSFLEFFLSVFPKIHRLADEFGERNWLVFKSFDMCHEQVRLLSHDGVLVAFRRGNGF